VAAIGIAAGIHHESPLSMALGLALLLACAAIRALLRLSARGVSVEREAPDGAFEGETIEVKVTLHNGSRLPIFFPRVAEPFPPELHAEKVTVFPYRIGPGESAEETYRGDCLLPRGVYTLGPLRLSLSDPFGWFQAARDLGGERKLKVYPRFQRFGVDEKAGQCVQAIAASLTRFAVGESQEFLSVREYRIGDPLKKVHWPLTAHRGYPVVKEHHRQAAGDVSIVLDLYRYALLGIGRGSSLEQAVKIAAALASRAVERGRRVELFAKGAREIRVPPGAGDGQVQRVLDALVEARPDGEVGLDDCLDRVRREVRAGSIVVLMVSPYLRDSERFERHVLGLLRGGGRAVAVIFDDATFHNLYEQPGRDQPAHEYAGRLAALGAETYVIPCGGDLPAIFARAAGARA
jgi:uncharacterized protein (DUF58 family)